MSRPSVAAPVGSNAAATILTLPRVIILASDRGWRFRMKVRCAAPVRQPRVAAPGDRKSNSEDWEPRPCRSLRPGASCIDRVSQSFRLIAAIVRDPGVIYSEDLRDWSDKATTPDQARMERYIDRYDLRGARILHIGIGNSGFAKRFHTPRRRDRRHDHRRTRNAGRAHALALPNYDFVVHNKYSGRDEVVEGAFDFILDNNPTSPCCCIRHLSDLFEFYVEKLAPRRADRHRPIRARVGPATTTNPRWSFDFDDLAAVGAGCGIRRLSDDQQCVRAVAIGAGRRRVFCLAIRQSLRRAATLPGGSSGAGRAACPDCRSAVEWACVETALSR